MASELETPLIILGPPRSGTTIIGGLLGRHPDVAYFEEPRSIWRWGNESYSDCIPAKEARPDVCEYIRNYFQTETRNQRKLRFIEKTPQNCLRPQFVSRIFPEARFLLLLRNPIATIASITEYWQESNTGRHRFPKRKKIIQRLSQTSPQQIVRYLPDLFRRLIPSRKSKTNVYWGPRLPGIAQLTHDFELEQVAALQWRACVESALHFWQENKKRVHLLNLESFDLSQFHETLDFARLPTNGELDLEFESLFTKRRAGNNRKHSVEFIERIAPIVLPTLCYMATSIPLFSYPEAERTFWEVVANHQE